MPEVTTVGMCAFAADPNRPGHIAFSYHGATATTPSPTQHGYLAKTTNLFSANPTFTGVQVDSNKEPLLPNGPPTLAGGAGTVPHSVSRFDYMGVTFSPVDGRPWGSFAKDVCYLVDCLDHPDTTITSGDNTQRNHVFTGWMGAVGTMAEVSTQ